ncbi:hypothetical protein EJ06DRAFT_120905 [Trichodelitschia bisporula]|uniref:Uncharacterized protein n=1 Tax=Trichodelitschia bisporula TaxID=703511 RepID=A0A6G1HPW0_9PEZI|nr:hypothetical protein EJ06DRAFT_120905 [Trichodelitschia bisporula]
MMVMADDRHVGGILASGFPVRHLGFRVAFSLHFVIAAWLCVFHFFWFVVFCYFWILICLVFCSSSSITSIRAAQKRRRRTKQKVLYPYPPPCTIPHIPPSSAWSLFSENVSWELDYCNWRRGMARRPDVAMEKQASFTKCLSVCVSVSGILFCFGVYTPIHCPSRCSSVKASVCLSELRLSVSSL